MFPLSSVARTLTVAGPASAGTHAYDQLCQPVAGCQVEPPSVETSTPPTTPLTSLAVPLMTRLTPAGSEAPFASEVMLTDEPVVSVEADAATSPACNVLGCAPMSASRFTVACRMF